MKTVMVLLVIVLAFILGALVGTGMGFYGTSTHGVIQGACRALDEAQGRDYLSEQQTREIVARIVNQIGDQLRSAEASVLGNSSCYDAFTMELGRFE